MSESQNSKPRVRKRMAMHGKSRTPEYAVWGAIVQRCRNKDNQAFENYGGRGIDICQRWRESFEEFLIDLGTRPPGDYSIERIDNDSGYFCGKCDDCSSRGIVESNCKWGTRVEQGNNRRTNVFVEHRGEKKTLQEWAREVGIKFQTLYTRIVQYGWDVDVAMTAPPRTLETSLTLDGVTRTVSEWSKLTGLDAHMIRFRIRKGATPEESLAPVPKTETVTLDGRTMTIKEWSDETGINKDTIRGRLKKGWPVEKAIRSPADPRRPRPKRVNQKRSSTGKFA